MPAIGRIYAGLILFGFVGIGAAAAGSVDPLLEQLRADHEILRAAERDYLSLRARAAMGPEEMADYEAYLQRLRARILRDCRLLAEIDRNAVAPSAPCPPPSVPYATPPAIDHRNEHTEAERNAALDAELNAALGKFDEMLLREQQEIRAAAPPIASGGGGVIGTSAPGTGEGYRTDPATREEPQSAERGDSAGTGPLDTAATSGAAGAGQGGGMPADAAGGNGKRTLARRQTPEGLDADGDDVVARQLREAAETEADPELKERLWQEYRRYKEGIR